MGSKKGRRPGGGRACFPTTLGKASLWLQTNFGMIRWVPQGRASSGLSSSWGGAPKRHGLPAQFFLPHRTSGLGPAEAPAVETICSEGGPRSAFPPGPAQADLVSASCSGGCSCSYRYLLKEFFWICKKGRYSNRKQARDTKGKIQIASTCTRKRCSRASIWWKVIDKPEGIWWGGRETVFSCPSI